MQGRQEDSALQISFRISFLELSAMMFHERLQLIE
jgi:hypothetical protein